MIIMKHAMGSQNLTLSVHLKYRRCTHLFYCNEIKTSSLWYFFVFSLVNYWWLCAMLQDVMGGNFIPLQRSFFLSGTCLFIHEHFILSEYFPVIANKILNKQGFPKFIFFEKISRCLQTLLIPSENCVDLMWKLRWFNRL